MEAALHTSPNPNSHRRRPRAAAALALLSALLAALTAAYQSWIEPLLGAAPDHRDGSLERLVVALALAVSIAAAARSLALAGRHPPRLAPARS